VVALGVTQPSVHSNGSEPPKSLKSLPHHITMSHKRSPTSEADAEAAKARKHPHSSHHEEPDAEPSPVPIAPSKIPPSDKQTWVVCLDGRYAPTYDCPNWIE
jgi:hypothetical protein